MPKKPIPFSFVLDDLAELEPYTRPMFGCTAVYVGERIVLILRDREDSPEDNGVWVATTKEHHESLRKDLPRLRSLGQFGPGATGWQVLPVEADDFEESALKACDLIRRGDVRIGKVPKGDRDLRACNLSAALKLFRRQLEPRISIALRRGGNV